MGEQRLRFRPLSWLPQRLIQPRLVGLCLLSLACFPVSPIVAGELGPKPLLRLEPHYRESVIRGWRAFQTSFARDGMACVNCHPQHGEIRLWAAAYPKLTVFNNSPYRVKGLAEAIGETLVTHTDLPAERRQALVDDLQTYISWWGEGRIIRPGHSKRLPPAAAGLKELRLSVRRGRQLVQDSATGSCLQCHNLEKSTAGLRSLSHVAGLFPRYVEKTRRVMSLEGFLRWHLAREGSDHSAPQERMLTDLCAYLVELASGQRFSPGSILSEGSDE